ncbi:hypothetical protein [Pseudomonas sp. 58 R 3]|nr:hypothetical protein [Pseudomonas sp. 58 R 3]
MREALTQRLGYGLLLLTDGLNDVQTQHDHIGQIAADLGQHLFDIIQGGGGLLGDAWADGTLLGIHPHLPGEHDAPARRHFEGLAEAVLQGVEHGGGIDDFALHDLSLLSVGKQS